MKIRFTAILIGFLVALYIAGCCKSIYKIKYYEKYTYMDYKGKYPNGIYYTFLNDSEYHSYHHKIITPDVYGTYKEEKSEIYLYPSKITHFEKNKVISTSKWNNQDSFIIEIHNLFTGKVFTSCEVVIFNKNDSLIAYSNNQGLLKIFNFDSISISPRLKPLLLIRKENFEGNRGLIVYRGFEDDFNISNERKKQRLRKIKMRPW